MVPLKIQARLSSFPICPETCAWGITKSISGVPVGKKTEHWEVAILEHRKDVRTRLVLTRFYTNALDSNDWSCVWLEKDCGNLKEIMNQKINEWERKREGNCCKFCIEIKCSTLFIFDRGFTFNKKMNDSLIMRFTYKTSQVRKQIYQHLLNSTKFI